MKFLKTMTKYFIRLKENQTGPFTIEELKEMNLTDHYWYWTEGLSTWRKLKRLRICMNIF